MGTPNRSSRTISACRTTWKPSPTAKSWPADKRNDDPLLFATHPDFVTFPPDGPLRQISIQQTRLLKERAQFLPHQGSRRIFLIDHVDRANEQAANSLLKTLEEPPDHLILIMTAENAYDLLPTIRSRAVPFQFAPLSRRGDARSSCAPAAWTSRSAASRWPPAVPGSPCRSIWKPTTSAARPCSLLLKVAAGVTPFGDLGARLGSHRPQQEREAGPLPEGALRAAARPAAAAARAAARSAIRTSAANWKRWRAKIQFAWIRKAVTQVDEIVDLIRRNIQKTIALDALIVDLSVLAVSHNPAQGVPEFRERHRRRLRPVD